MKGMLRKWNLVLAAAVVLWAIGFAGLAVYAGQTSFPSGFAWGDWQLGGVREAAFRAELQQRLDALLQRRVRFELPAAAGAGAGPAAAGGAGAAGASTFTLAELGVQVDAARLDAAAAQLFRGARLERAEARWSLRGARLPLELRAERTAVLRAVGSRWPQLLQARPQDARRVITADDRVGYVPGQAAVQVDADALLELLGELAEQWFYKPAAALGPGGDIRLLALPAEAEPLPVTLPLQTIQPAVTVDTLRAQGVDRKIAEFTTFFPISGEGRKFNIRSTAQTIQDTLLKPGEEFDYSQIIRATEKQFGFKEAPVILNGKLVPGVGGGICQVSTTLYNAVLRAGLEITERRNHSLPISYAPLGQDATYADGWINFRFRNTTGVHLLIRTDVTDAGITVKLFGRLDDQLTYEIVSNTVETIPPPVKVVVNPSLGPNQEVLLLEGKPGYIVETFRIRKRNGVEEARERISRDTYTAQPMVVARNKAPGKPNPEPPKEKRNVLEDGISGPTFSQITGAFRQ